MYSAKEAEQNPQQIDRKELRNALLGSVFELVMKEDLTEYLSSCPEYDPPV